MENEDVALKRYFADNERYADLINGFALGGQQLVKAEDLSVMDSQNNGGRRSGKKTRYRDLIRRTAFGVNFAIVGIENQSEVHYLMPVRCMGYDVREYERQSAVHRKRVKQKKSISQAEFLSGFRKEDRLHPCITIVLYYGDDWDGSKDLHSLLDFSEIPPELQHLVNNYQVHILDVKRLESTEAFRTDLKQVFDFIRFSRDKQKLKELSEKDPAYMEMDEDAYDVAVAFTKAEELISIKKREGGSMCQALKELLQDERAEGRLEGRLEGRAEGQACMAVLIQKLMSAGRNADLLRATKDEEFLKKLYAEFRI